MNDDELLAVLGADDESQQPEPPDFGEIGGYEPINWRDLEDEDARAVWNDLRDWVEWVYGRYALHGVIAACWWRHGGVVEELSALYTGWLVCFDERDSGLGPLQWHERFHQALGRLRERNGCRAGHVPADPPSLATDPDQWAAWAARSHAFPDAAPDVS